MGQPRVYRGGPDLMPTVRDVKIDQATGLLKPTHGISLNADSAALHRFGGAYEVMSVPEGLLIQQRGKRPGHYELTPAEAMTWERYVELLRKVVLKPPP